MAKDVIVSDTLGEILRLHSGPDGGACAGDLVRVILCTEGSFSLLVDGRSTRLHSGDMLICIPDVSMGPDAYTEADSAEGRAKMLAVSYSRFLQRIPTVRNIWTILMSTRSNPVFPLSESDKRLTICYYEVIRGKLATEKGWYYDEIMQSLIQCAIFEICVILNRSMGDSLRESQMSSKDVLYKRFLELISEDGGRHRSVSYHADKLCVSPKYLSQVCCSVCGISAHEILLQEASRQIQLALSHTDMSIKEIASDFGFPDLSSFGKFVRTRLGRSPRDIKG